MTAPPIQLSGSSEQCRELLEAVSMRRMILMRMGGIDTHVDHFVSTKDDILAYWQGALQAAGVDGLSVPRVIHELNL